MVYAMLVGFLASAPVRSLVVSQDAAAEPVRVVCPVNRSTTVVFPEAMRQLRAPGAGVALGLSVERMKPQGTIVVRPSVHPAQAIVEFLGPTASIRVRLETAADGEDSEVRLVLQEPSVQSPDLVGQTPPEPAPTPSVPPASVPVAASPIPPAPASAPGSLLDLEGVLRARPVAIGRREGLPGQRAMVLVDALQGEKWVWFRFSLEGGARARLARVSWEKGDVGAWVQEPDGKNLRIIVQLPRAEVTPRAHLSLEVESGPTYTFALDGGSLGRFLKGLFQK